MTRVIHCGARWGEAGCGTCPRCLEQATRAARLSSIEPLPVQPQHVLSSFSLHSPPQRRGQSARSKSIDAVLEHLGLGRR
jgi:hypothetical protein